MQNMIDSSITNEKNEKRGVIINNYIMNEENEKQENILI